jgi:hypothetical protein
MMTKSTINNKKGLLSVDRKLKGVKNLTMGVLKGRYLGS